MNITNVQSFLSNVQDHLNANVQKLFLKYSPTNVRSFIVNYYQAFLTNISTNNGTQSEILTMNLLYLNNILKSSATACMSKYNAAHYEIYLEAASDFTRLMENQTSSTAAQLETLRKEIKDLVKSIVKSVEKIIANKETARVEFDNFVRSVKKLKLNIFLKMKFSDQKQRKTFSRQGRQLGFSVQRFVEGNSKRHQNRVHSV